MQYFHDLRFVIQATDLAGVGGGGCREGGALNGRLLEGIAPSDPQEQEVSWGHIREHTGKERGSESHELSTWFSARMKWKERLRIIG